MATTCARARSRGSRRSWRAWPPLPRREAPFWESAMAFKSCSRRASSRARCGSIADLRYVCATCICKVENVDTPFTRLYDREASLTMPIGHMEGNYTASPDVLDRLERDGQVVFRYCDAEGRLTDAANPNGADRAIAGIANREGNVVGLDASSRPLRGSRARATTPGSRCSSRPSLARGARVN